MASPYRLCQRAPACAFIAIMAVLAASNCANAQLNALPTEIPEPAASAQALTLAQAIERALEASPQLRSVESGLAAAEGEAEQAGLRPNPELAFEIENLGGTGPYTGIEGSVYTLGVQQRIELGGKRRLRRQVADSDVTSQQYLLNNQRLKLISGVRIAYIRVIAAQEQLALAQEHRALARTLLNEMEKRVQAARAPQLQLSKAQIALARARLVEDEQARELRHAQHVLASFWLEEHQRYDYDPAPFFELTAPFDEAALEQALQTHPEVLYEQAIQQRQQAQLRLAKAKALPDPNVGVGLRQFEQTGDQAMVLELSMPLPIFDRNQGNVRSARARLQQGLSDEQASKLALTAQGLQALEEMINAYERAMALAETIIPSAERAFALAREGYTAGRFPYLEVLDAQRTLFDSKLDHIAALATYQSAKAEVEFVMAHEWALKRVHHKQQD